MTEKEYPIYVFYKLRHRQLIGSKIINLVGRVMASKTSFVYLKYCERLCSVCMHVLLCISVSMPVHVKPVPYAILKQIHVHDSRLLGLTSYFSFEETGIAHIHLHFTLPEKSNLSRRVGERTPAWSMQFHPFEFVRFNGKSVDSSSSSMVRIFAFCKQGSNRISLQRIGTCRFCSLATMMINQT